MYTKYYLNLVTWFRVFVKQCYLKKCDCEWRKFCSRIEGNSIIITTLFRSFTTALYHWVMCEFRTQNNKSNDLYLLMMAQSNCRTRNWTIQTLWICPQCAVRCEQETQKYSNNRHCVNLYRQVSAEGHGHWGSVKSRSEPPLQDSSNAASAAILEICVFQKKVWHIVVRKVVMSKCSI